MRPKLLKDFGWNVCQVFAKDWYQARHRVVDRVLALAGGEPDADPDEGENEKSSMSEAAQAVNSNLDGNGESVDIEANEQLPPIQSDLMEMNRASDDSQAETAKGRHPTDRSTEVDGQLTRNFELTDETSNKFWEITLAGNRHSVRF